MRLEIRKATAEDEQSVSRICLLTADAGTSSEALHDFGELPGLVYAVPYLKLPTTWAFVLEEGVSKEVVGYIVGSSDTRAYERYAAEHWWPPLTAKYTPEGSVKPADIQYAERLRNMHTAPDANIAFSPAHMHINILEKHQKQGWGRKMIATAVESLIGEGLQGFWLGVDPRNDSAKNFYKRIGFQRIVGADENQFGLRFDEFRKTNQILFKCV
ncbi:acyl-CoA N-acyltransferase [Pholiota conissans]|uniref:Acyl-CoA N-acyltransferase n=1 Tax=Pholiota conissans TaxID=109636 RepID=A0A9P5YXR1_9AGAR|nr:acyl-CoA N-acyltransferase [Pholiota conissans]